MKNRIYQLLINKAFWLVVITSISAIAAIKIDPDKLVVYISLSGVLMAIINFMTKDYKRTKTKVDDILHAATDKFGLKDNEDDKRD